MFTFHLLKFCLRPRWKGTVISIPKKRYFLGKVWIESSKAEACLRGARTCARTFPPISWQIMRASVFYLSAARLGFPPISWDMCAGTIFFSVSRIGAPLVSSICFVSFFCNALVQFALVQFLYSFHRFSSLPFYIMFHLWSSFLYLDDILWWHFPR